VPLPELIVIQFNQNCFGEGFLALAEAAPIKRLLALAETGLHFLGPITATVAELMRNAVEQRGLDRLLRLIETLSLLTRCTNIAALATRDYCSNTDVSPVNRKRIEIIHRYIRENLAADIAQQEIARRLGLSSPEFSRFFKAATGKTFVTFVNTLRVNEACRRLQNSSMPITEIAMACGYNNVSNFNRRFLELRGMNPSQYRRCVHRKSEQHAHYTDVRDSSVGIAHR
jgi:transcriptional regulator GlxA family with amidase domain